MPRRLLGVFMLLLVSVLVGQAQGDVVLLTVGKDTVSREEYVYHLRRASDRREAAFVRTLACFKQKVQAARELGLDTVTAYRREVELFRSLLEKQGRLAEGRKGHRPSGKEWVKLVHVTCPLGQHADKRREKEARRTMDSLYVALTEGKGDVQLETMPWVQTRFLLNEWKDRLKTLDRGVYSKPFYSPQGIHVIAWTDKREDELPEEHGAADDRCFRVKEMEEGLLVASLDDWLEKTMVCTEPELEEHFRKHRAGYGWGTPHYQGAVIHCQDKKEARRIKKYLQKYPQSLWAEALERMPEDVSGGCRMEMGFFAIGSNPYVDKLVFKCGEFETVAGYPYTWVLGKKLKKGPSAYTDVRERVVKDYKITKKKAETAALIEKYRVEIDKEVLKTVNHDGNK